MSVEDASFDTWIKYYRQDENSVNSQVDYYDKGAILGLPGFGDSQAEQRRKVSRRRNALSVRGVLQARSQLHTRGFSESLRVDGGIESGTVFCEVRARSGGA